MDVVHEIGKKSFFLENLVFFYHLCKPKHKAMDKRETYTTLIPQIRSLVEGENNTIGLLANVSAALREAFGERFFWVGFYVVRDAVGNGSGLGRELVLGPFQGPPACLRIAYGRGVCGTAWKEARTVVVPDVEAFPGHIACSSLSRSEIVVPVFASTAPTGLSATGDGGHSATAIANTAPTLPSAAGKGPVSDPQGADCTGIARPKPIAVLDIDSKDLATFDSTDALWLEKICKLL